VVNQVIKPNPSPNASSKTIAHWQRLNTRLAEALSFEIDDEALRAWLKTLPATESDLLPELQKMLGLADSSAEDFLTRPVVLPALVDSLSRVDVENDEVGPYRLISELGSGGMGAVWLAERSDGSLKRQVALKLPISRWAPGLAERMRRERDILSTLEHPNIARLYDAGVTEEGRPYLALEYVEGVPIDTYCQEHKVDARSSLGLFLQVATAVSHAHEKLVVHRDLKPTNILVTKDGDVRLLDFGIAKLLDPDADLSESVSLELTRITGKSMTLSYASPEQIRGGRVTVASDVYSLGVVLFEMLTGQRPYKPKRNSQGAMEDAIIEQDAPRASNLVTGKLAKMLSGDIDVILAKALKKKTAERYRSVESFADDIVRYLNGEPVHAQPDSAWYRTEKFIRRRTGLALTCASIVLAIGAGVTVALWQARVARVEAARAEEVKQFIASIFSSAIPRTGEGGAVLATDLLTAASKRIDAELGNSPRVAAELGIIVGESFGDLGEPQKGEEVLKIAVKKAEKEFGNKHPLTLRGKYQLAAITKHTDRAGTQKILDELIVDARTQLPQTAKSLESALADRAFIATKAGDAESALALFRESVAVSEKYLGTNSESAIYNRGMLSYTYGIFGRLSEQLEAAEETLKRAEQAFGAHRPNGALIAAQRNYATALRGSNRPGDAIPILRQVLIDQRSYDAAETGRVRFAMHELGRALSATGQLAEAIPLQRQVIEYEHRNNKHDTDNRVIAGEPLIVSLLYARLVNEASVEHDRIYKVQTLIGNESDSQRLRRQSREALILALQGQHVAADTLVKAIVNETVPANGLATASVQTFAAAIRIAVLNQRLQQQYDKANAYLQLLQLNKSAEPIALRTQIDIAAERGSLQLAQGQIDDAENTFNQCSKLIEQAQIKLSASVAACVIGRARVLLKKNKPIEAQQDLSRLAVDWLSVNPNCPWHGETLFWLSIAESQMDNHGVAAKLYLQSRAMLRLSSLPALNQLKSK
jgi:eukaryotic-like serine/threonine-protein kinase